MFEHTLSLSHLALDAVRPAAEYGALVAAPVYYGAGVPRGDGRPVLVIPGYLSGDAYLQPLRGWLQRMGYAPAASGLSSNPGWADDVTAALLQRALDAFEDTGQRVTIVGHSLGGLQGRALGTARPDVVRHVVALGSPLALARGRLPAALRMTAVYSREDRIVPEPAAREADPRGRNVEVAGSHMGLPFNPAVYRCLGRALAAPDREVV